MHIEISSDRSCQKGLYAAIEQILPYWSDNPTTTSSRRVCVCVCVCVCDCLSVYLSDWLSGCLSVASHTSETNEAIANTFDKVTYNNNNTNNNTTTTTTNTNNTNLDLWLQEWVLQDTGQCLLSKRAFGVKKSVSLYAARIQNWLKTYGAPFVK